MDDCCRCSDSTLLKSLTTVKNSMLLYIASLTVILIVASNGCAFVAH